MMAATRNMARDAGTPRSRRLDRDQSATSARCLARRVPAAAAVVVALAREVTAAPAAVTLGRPPAAAAAVALARAALRSRARSALERASSAASVVVALLRAVAAATAEVALVCAQAQYCTSPGGRVALRPRGRPSAVAAAQPVARPPRCRRRSVGRAIVRPVSRSSAS